MEETLMPESILTTFCERRKHEIPLKDSFDLIIFKKDIETGLVTEILKQKICKKCIYAEYKVVV